MGRKPGSVNKTEAKPSDGLVDALKFILVAGTKDHTPSMQHCLFHNGFVLAFDGQIAAGYPVDEDLTCAPNLKLLHKSLSKTGKTLALTLLENGILSVKGENIRANVPCLPLSDMFQVVPDTPVAVINDRLKQAFTVCGVFTEENGKRLLETSLLLRGFDCTGSDGHSVIQYAHGIDLPPDLVIPITFADAVAKTPQKLTAFGWTQGHSITFYFDGGMWLKTLLYADPWPDIDQLFNQQFSPIGYPATLLEAVDAVDDFSENHSVYFRDNSITSHANEGVGAAYDVPGLQAGKIIDPKYLKKLLPHAQVMDYTSDKTKVYFQGENLRGIFMGRVG